MEELGSLERHDRQRRQEAVARIPVILHKGVVILFFMSFMSVSSFLIQKILFNFCTANAKIFLSIEQ